MLGQRPYGLSPLWTLPYGLSPLWPISLMAYIPYGLSPL